MKVKDWLSVINLDDSDAFDVRVLDDDYCSIGFFNNDEIGELIKRYGENQIKNVDITTYYNYYDFMIELCLDIKHIPSKENPFE